MASSFSPSTRLPLLSPPSFSKSHFTHKPFFSLLPKNPAFTLYTVRASADNGAGTLSPVATEKEPVSEQTVVVPGEESSMAKGSAAVAGEVEAVKKFDDPKWVGGTWELKQFSKNGGTDWDAVIDAEAKRRKWLENNPESSSNEDPVIFETSIIPWWAWIKRYHLPEAELLNGRAAMIGFFMAYFVDSLTGVGLVDQMGNFFCKTLLFIAVSGVLLIRKNEDLVTLKKLFEETTYYDKQWQAAWKDESNSSSKTE